MRIYRKRPRSFSFLVLLALVLFLVGGLGLTISISTLANRGKVVCGSVEMKPGDICLGNTGGSYEIVRQKQQEAEKRLPVFLPVSGLLTITSIILAIIYYRVNKKKDEEWEEAKEKMEKKFRDNPGLYSKMLAEHLEKKKNEK